MTFTTEGRGGLVRDPEFSFTPNGSMPVWRASVADSKPRYNSETRQQEVSTDYYSLVAFGTLAEEFAEMDLHQGDEVYVKGELGQYTKPGQDGERGERKTQIQPYFLHVTRRRRSTPRPTQQSTQQYTGSSPWDAPPPSDEPPF